MIMKKKLIKRLHEIIMEIVNADEAELNAIGIELLEIEKKLVKYQNKDTDSLLKKI